MIYNRQMKKEIQVILKSLNFSNICYVPSGKTCAEILNICRVPNKKEIIINLVNNTYTDLNHVITHDSEIQYISCKENTGLKFYRNSSVFILSHVINKLFHKNILNIGPSIYYNYYFDLHTDKKVDKKLLTKINKEFDKVINSESDITPIMLSEKEAVKHYEKQKEYYKVKLVKQLNADHIKFYKINNYMDICAGPMAPNTSIIKKYRFVLYPPGFMLEFPKVIKNKLKLYKSINPKKLSKVFLQTRDWYKTQNVSNVSQLNSLIKKDKLNEIINISEALHEKRISHIADVIAEHKKDIKFIFVAGPSSSGKTSFVKRLSIQLQVNGLKPVSISIDNYFLNRKQTPKDKNGNYDFECLEALDLNLFNKHLNDLLKGKKINIPQFDFFTGKQKDKTNPLLLKKDEIILIEGIHGLNEKLTYAIPKNKKFKVYVSALSQLRISNNYRIPTSDTRLFRRIVRDYVYRNHTAQETLKMWPTVRKGEEKYIFPFQEDADIIFNSALIYETSILKPMALKYLKMVSYNVPEYATAKRLIDILDYFKSGTDKSVPKVSILREFIGGSAFKY